MSVNITIISGNLGSDPQTKSIGSSTVTSFSVAVNKRTMVDGEWTDTTVWWNIDVFGKLGETCAKYLTKGRRVTVEGKVQGRAYLKDDEARAVRQMRASDVRFGARNDAGNNYAEPEEDFGDIPF